MLLSWILFDYLWYLVVCILNLSIYYKFESIIFFFVFVLSSSYASFGCRRLNVEFSLLLACYDVVFFIVLLRHFICVMRFRHAKHIRSIK